MPGSVAWQWKADDYPRQTGSSICRSSHQEAFDERCRTLPRNSVECGFSRYSPSKVLCTVEGLELILSERNAYSFYDQAGSGASQACADQKCRDAVKSGGNIICGQQCHGSFWQTLALYLELVQWSMP